MVIQEAATIQGIPPRAVHAAFTVTVGSRLRLLTHDGREASQLSFVRVAGAVRKTCVWGAEWTVRRVGGGAVG